MDIELTNVFEEHKLLVLLCLTVACPGSTCRHLSGAQLGPLCPCLLTAVAAALALAVWAVVAAGDGRRLAPALAPATAAAAAATGAARAAPTPPCIRCRGIRNCRRTACRWRRL